MKIVICGAGAIGCSLAYFLSTRGAEVVVVERTAVAAAASGKSGGFLALDWCDGSPLEGLARRSFELHDELNATLSGRWGYRRLDTLSVVASARRDLGGRSRSARPEWVAERAAVRQQLGTSATTAQVDPAAFTRGMIDAAVANGARVEIGAVERVVLDDGRVRGVVADDATIEANAVVIAMGPWSVLASQWLPLPAVHGLKGNSIVLRSTPEITPHALFVDCESADGSVDAPEVFPRVDGTTYICGLSGTAPLPVDPAQVVPDEGARERLRGMAKTFAPALGDAEIVTTGACYRPVIEDGLPLMGAVPEIDGAFVATGHSVWGMLNAPASGEAMAELILDGAARTVDLRPFDPARLPALPAGAIGS
jgi:glycine/D-amino acid oxidase-like deaminating enzyme